MIEIPRKLIEYFGRSNLPVFWSVRRVMENDMEFGEMIGNIIERVDEILLSDYEDTPTWLSNIQGFPHKDRKMQTAIQIISDAVAVKRLSMLSSDYNKEIIRPYNHPDLSGVLPDADGLTKLKYFDFGPSFFPGLKQGQTIFEIVPSIPKAENSMYWTIQELIKLSNKAYIHIRLDPLMIHSVSDYSRVFYKMRVYGKSLDWNALICLKEEDHMRWQPDPGWQDDVEFTDLFWSPREDGIHIICEEVPRISELRFRGSRYSHGIYSPDRHVFTHCDGAIRVYTKQELNNRRRDHVRRIGKIGKRIKIFLVDGEITAEEWTQLTCAFFVWNNDVQNYFGVGIKPNHTF